MTRTGWPGWPAWTGWPGWGIYLHISFGMSKSSGLKNIAYLGFFRHFVCVFVFHYISRSKQQRNIVQLCTRPSPSWNCCAFDFSWFCYELLTIRKDHRRSWDYPTHCSNDKNSLYVLFFNFYFSNDENSFVILLFHFHLSKVPLEYYSYNRFQRKVLWL